MFIPDNVWVLRVQLRLAGGKSLLPYTRGAWASKHRLKRCIRFCIETYKTFRALRVKPTRELRGFLVAARASRWPITTERIFSYFRE